MGDKIFDIVKKSKKYSSICDETIRRICAQEIPKYKKEKEIVKALKNKLHQISESYFSENSSSELKCLKSGEDVDFNKLLQIHSSTSERLSFYEEFYDDIFRVVGNVDSILDIACGLNPIMLGEYCRQRGYEFGEYIAEDINLDALRVVRHYFDMSNRPVKINAADLLISIPTAVVDVALLFKIVPLLEQQKKGYYVDVINELRANFIVVTFPTKTMSGKLVGMLDNYKNLFDGFISSGDFRVLFSKTYSNELVYVISR